MTTLPSDAQFRLQMGELTDAELRIAKAAYRMAKAEDSTVASCGHSPCVPCHNCEAPAPDAGVVPFDDAAVERALVFSALHEDGAQWPDAYSEDEQNYERENMRALLAAAANTNGPSAYCRACQAAGLRNCGYFDECSGATCVTCHQPLNRTRPASDVGVKKEPTK